MQQFYLPDLGEGLPDAEIQEWHVAVGDTVAKDQKLVSVETAKAVVDIPSPQAGTIETLHAQAGARVPTGALLVSFIDAQRNKAADKRDSQTVAGALQSSEISLPPERQGVAASAVASAVAHRGPLFLAKAKALGLSPNAIPATIHSIADLETFARTQSTSTQYDSPLTGFRKRMAEAMRLSKEQVVPVTVYDEACFAEHIKHQYTVTLIKAICFACSKEPALNAWYDPQSDTRTLHNAVHLGLAIDTAEGLYVPCIPNANQKSDTALEKELQALKTAALANSLTREQMQRPTITLSNFGKFGGRFATPVVVPPQVAILAVGAIREENAHYVAPLSFTFDHQSVTGGEAARFLASVKDYLEKGCVAT